MTNTPHTHVPASPVVSRRRLAVGAAWSAPAVALAARVPAVAASIAPAIDG